MEKHVAGFMASFIFIIAFRRSFPQAAMDSGGLPKSRSQR